MLIETINLDINLLVQRNVFFYVVCPFKNCRLLAAFLLKKQALSLNLSLLVSGQSHTKILIEMRFVCFLLSTIYPFENRPLLNRIFGHIICKLQNLISDEDFNSFLNYTRRWEWRYYSKDILFEILEKDYICWEIQKLQIDFEGN